MARTPFYREERVVALGAFASDMGGYLEIYGNWEPEEVLADGKLVYTPEQAALYMLEVGGYLGAVEVPLLEAQRIAIEKTQEGFDTQTDPDGNDWEILNEDYRNYKVNIEGYPDMILQRTQAMMRGATSREAWPVIGNTLMFNPKALPTDEKGTFYPGIMQTGSTKTNPPRYEFHEKYVGGKVRLGGLPPRPFIGMSYEAVDEIDAAFLTWAENVPENLVGGLVGELTLGSNILGEFPIMGYYGVQPILRTPRGPRFGRIP